MQLSPYINLTNEDNMNYINECWMPVLKLCSFNSNWTINKWYYFKEGLYYVSNMGRFSRGNNIVYGTPDSRGTLTFKLGPQRFKLHQIVLQTFKPEGIQDGYSPDHINRSDRLNNSLENLRWANK